MLLISAFAIVDLITPGALKEARPGNAFPLVLPGAIAGQLGLLAVWAVIGPQRLLVRWPLSLLVATLLWCVFLLGMTMSDGPDREIREATLSTLMLPIVFLAVQLPLWILRMATGWRIVVGHSEDYSLSTQSRQFRLQQMLGATTVIAVALGLAGVGLPHLSGSNGGADSSMWLVLMLVCLMCSVWSAFSTLPCVWAAFVARSKTAGTIVIAVYTVLMSTLVVAVVSAIAGPPPSFGEGMKVVTLFHGGLVFVLFGSLHVARACGYVLLRPGRTRPPATPTGTSPFADSSGPTPAATEERR